MDHVIPTLLQPARRARRNTHPLLAILVALAVSLLPAAVVVPPLTAALKPEFMGAVATLDVAGRTTAFLLVLPALIIGLLWLWLAAVERRPLWTVGFFGRRAAAKVVAGFVLAVVLNLAPLAAARLGGWGAVPAGGLPGWPTLVGAVLILGVGWLPQGATEEIIYRGFLTQSIGLRWPLAAAVIIQAVVFTASHALFQRDPLQFVGDFLVGLFLAGYVLREGDLWGACAFHGAWNWSNSVGDIWFTGAPGLVDNIRDLLIPLVAALVVFLSIWRCGIPRSTP